MFKTTLFVAMAVAGGAQVAHSRQAAGQRDSYIRIPAQMAAEHEALHRELANLIAAGGRTGDAAGKVENVLTPHFEEENRFALPPLGLLPALASGQATETMRPAIEMARHVRQNLERFASEHAAITRALDDLEMAAKAERRSGALGFAADLRAHAQHEEEVLYPTTPHWPLSRARARETMTEQSV